MKIIKSAQYEKEFEPRQVYDPDEREFVPTDNYEFINNEEDNENIPDISPEDIGTTVPIADETDEQEITEEEIEPVTTEQDKYPEFASPSEAMRYAVTNRQAVRIFYQCKNGPFIIRDVEPHGMFTAKTTHNLITVTWDRDVNWYRAFITPNMQKFQWVGEEFSPKFNFRQERSQMLGRNRQRKYRKLNKL